MRSRTSAVRFAPYLLFLLVALALFAFSVADARNVRGGTHQSVHQAGGGHRSAPAARGGGGASRQPANANRGGNRQAANVNRDRANTANRNTNRDTNRSRDMNRDVNRNRNVNRNIDRDVNINRDIDIDVDNGWDGHPIARGVAFGTAAAVTSAVVGSMIYSLPPACVTSPYGSYTYYNCNGVWYEPRYAGTSVTYVVINQPY